jgi:hypothetical protein
VQSIFLAWYVKCGIIILQNAPSKPTPSSEKQGAKTCFLPLFWSHAFYFYVDFEQKRVFCTILPFYLLANSQKFIAPKTAFSR